MCINPCLKLKSTTFSLANIIDFFWWIVYSQGMLRFFSWQAYKIVISIYYSHLVKRGLVKKVIPLKWIPIFKAFLDLLIYMTGYMRHFGIIGLSEKLMRPFPKISMIYLLHFMPFLPHTSLQEHDIILTLFFFVIYIHTNLYSLR